MGTRKTWQKSGRKTREAADDLPPTTHCTLNRRQKIGRSELELRGPLVSMYSSFFTLFIPLQSLETGMSKGKQLLSGQT